MDKLGKLANAVFVVFMVLVVYIFYHYYNREEPIEIDTDGDGVISPQEIKEYIKKELDRRSKRPPQFRGILKSALSGALRGAFMGLLLNGVEGAVTSAIVLGMINPIITGMEHMY